LDALIRIIERLVQGIVSIIQPLVENGNLGYLAPFLLLAAATFFALTAKNRTNLVGYMMGWVVAIALVGLYQESNGDNLLVNITGVVPRSDLVMPIFWGLVTGFLLLFPFLRRRLVDVQPLIIALVTGFSVILMFITYRASVSITVVQSAGVENLITYRKRFVGVFALTFGIGVLMHVLISASNPPRPPPTPPHQSPRA
jgi:hypothetical protein